MQKSYGDVKAKGKVLTGSDKWLENVRDLEVTRDTEINLWSSKGSVLEVNDYVHVYDSCKNGIGKIYFTSLFVRNEILSVGEAWDCYGGRNGAPDFNTFKEMVRETLSISSEADIENYSLKCTIIKNVCPFVSTEMFIRLEGRGQIRESGRFV